VEPKKKGNKINSAGFYKDEALIEKKAPPIFNLCDILSEKDNSF
jgi:hypothetical protein